MLLRPERARRLDRVMNMLRDGKPPAELISSTADVCERVVSSHESQHIKELIHAGAWTDVALALLAVELPAWKLRRLAYDEGEWHCAISHERELPEWLDGAIETRHADLFTAILKAVVEGLRITDEEQHGGKRIRIPLDAQNLVSCDNFG